jgi:hypothetical protein
MKIKKIVSSLLIAGTLATSQMASRPADAGIIFFPFGVGIVLLVVGLVDHDDTLIILDADGQMNHDQLVQKLAKSFPAIDQDRDVLENLAGAIRSKAANTAPNAKGQVMVSLSSDEVLSILAPTGLAETDPAAAQQIVAALQ